MEFSRRKALVGLGATAAISGGIIGTGALTSIEADRTINIDVQGDSSAFVGMYDTSGSAHVDKNSGALRVRLNGDIGSGSGVNHGTVNGDVATTTLDPAFTLKNQGGDVMYVQISHSGNTSGGGHDVEFVGDDSASNSGTTNADQTSGDVISTTNNLAFIDRADAGTGGDLSDDAIATSVHSGGATTTIDEAGFMKVDVGEAVDVALQIASDTTGTGNIISAATIQAFNETGVSGLSGSQITSA